MLNRVMLTLAGILVALAAYAEALTALIDNLFINFTPLPACL